MSTSSERIKITKRDRFSIFSRDGFTCKYCGKQPPAVLLVIDHVVPISRGGTNHPDNLITACEECNQGKSNKPTAPSDIPEESRLAIAQEQMEVIRIAEETNRAVNASIEMRSSICNYYCAVTGETEMSRSLLSQLVNIARDLGPKNAMKCVDVAVMRLGVPDGSYRERQFAKYVSGIAKHIRTDMEVSEELNA